MFIFLGDLARLADVVESAAKIRGSRFASTAALSAVAKDEDLLTHIERELNTIEYHYKRAIGPTFSAYQEAKTLAETEKKRCLAELADCVAKRIDLVNKAAP